MNGMALVGLVDADKILERSKDEVLDAHRIVWQWRERMEDLWPTPSRFMCKVFAGTEAWEAVDAWTRSLDGYARNRATGKDEMEEWADCAMMVLSAYRWPKDVPLDIMGVTSDRLYLADMVSRWVVATMDIDYEAHLAGDILHSINGKLEWKMASMVSRRLERIAKKVGYRGG